MPELRKDPIVGRWVIISTERAKRPNDFSRNVEPPMQGQCPFCEGNEGLTPHEIYAVRNPDARKPDTRGWQIRVVPSIHPVLRIEGDLGRRGSGMYDMMNGVGAHEVIIETPKHVSGIADLDDGQINKVLLTYIERINDLHKDRRFKYVLVFKNYGSLAGASSIRHSHSQLIATPVNPKLVKEELVGARRYYDYKERCIFCDVIKQDMDSQERLVMDLDGFVAITPFAPRFPFEVWILPKEHSCDFSAIKKPSIEHLAKMLRTIMRKLKAALGDPPYNYVIHTAPFRIPKAGYWRTIEQDYHWHIEIMPRLTKVAGFEWGTGCHINPTSPEDAAKYLREVNENA